MPELMKNSVLSAVLLAVVAWGCTRRNITLVEMEIRITNELPVGSTRAKVIDFLDLQGAEISQRVPKVVARIRHASTTVVCETVIVMQFEFDSEDHLVSHSAREDRICL